MNNGNQPVDRDALFREINRGLLEERRGAFRRNLGKNLDLIKKFGGLRRVLPGFAGKDVVVAAAGPSLEKDYAALRRYQHREEVVIIAADMALRPLVGQGIYPRFVISCETTPADFFGSLPTEKMHLLAFSCMSGANLRRWKGDISFYNWMIHEPPFHELWKEAGEDLGYLATGSIITTQAVAFALGCPIRSLALAGNDLAFGRNYYTRGTVTHGRILRMADRWVPAEELEHRSIRLRKDYILKRGDAEYMTSHQFLAAKYWLEELFGKQSVPVFDSSVPGCSEKYVQKTELKKFFERYERNPRKRR